METRDGAKSSGAAKGCGPVLRLSRGEGRVVSVGQAGSGRVGSGRRRERGRSGCASGRLGRGFPRARGEPGQPVRGSRCDILWAGGWVQNELSCGFQSLRKLFPVSVS